MTPSQLPDFPEYQRERRSWELPNSKDSDVEKSVKSGETTFYDDGSDTDDEVDIEKTITAQVTVQASAVGKKSTIRWFKYRRV